MTVASPANPGPEATEATPDTEVPVHRAGIRNYVALITAILFGAVSVGMLTWSGKQWDQHFARMMPLMDNLMLARDAVSEGYVWVEAHLRDDETVDEETIGGAFGLAVKAVDAAMAATVRDTPQPGETALNARLTIYRAAIAQTGELARERVRLSTGDPAARQLDLRLFTALHGLGLMSESVNAAVQKEWQQTLTSQRRLQDWTLVVWVTLIVGASAALMVTGYRRTRAESELARAHQGLEQKVRERTAELAETNRLLSDEVEERRQTERALSRSETDLRALSAQLITVQEDERSRLARALHDGTTQDLGAIKFRVEYARSQVLAGDTDAAAAACEEVVALLQDTLEAIRTTYMALRPFQLDDLGLFAALTWLCREFRERHPEIDVELELPDEETDLPEAFRVTVFRIVQESLENIGEHSGASSATVSLTARSQALELRVVDDGAGLPPPMNGDEGPTLGVGLRTIRERVRSTGGTLELDSSPGGGTRVTVRWPEEALPPDLEPE